MKIFISWSGDLSKKVATALKVFLEFVFQGDEAFMSDTDIPAGERWADILNAELKASYFGIICLTPQNLTAPWILFEAGALSKAMKSTKTQVAPYMVNLIATDIIGGPLSLFQGVTSEMEGTLKLVQSINKVRGEKSLPEEKLEPIFMKWWPDLELILKNLLKENTLPKPKVTERDMLEEILTLLRETTRFPQIYNEQSIEAFYKPKLDPITTYSASDLATMNTSAIVDYLTDLRWRLMITPVKQEKEVWERLIKLVEKELEARRK